MAYKTQASFTGGELDPALQERVTLQKYSTGLKTAKGVVVGKTGRLISRPGRKYLGTPSSSGKKIILYTVEDTNMVLVFDDTQVRRIYTSGSYGVAASHSYSEDDLPLLRFAVVYNDIDSGQTILAVMLKGSETKFLTIVGDLCSFSTSWNTEIGAAPTYLSGTSGASTSNSQMEYICSYIEDGVESSYAANGSPSMYFPAAVTEENKLDFSLGASTRNITAAKIYRRPHNGSSYGFVGYARIYISGGTTWYASFTDVGVEADYTHQPPSATPTIIDEGLTDPGDFNSRTGVYYQRRLILSYAEKLEASRTKFYDLFYRDYPYSSDSGLSFGADKEVLHLVDSDGLVVFTTDGVYLNLGALSPSNIALSKKGNWVADDLVPPIAIPGGVLFIDSKTNVVRELAWSQENGSYSGEELSIFSDHLFKGIKITSWAFDDGDIPLLWVTFENGTYASFTYEKNQLMKAWTRHSSGYGVEYVAAMRNTVDFSSTPYDRGPGKVFFVTNKDGQRYIEMGVPRYVSADIAATDTESDKNESIAAMDAMVSWSRLINDELTTDDLTLVPVVADDWEGQITMTTTVDSPFTTGDLGAVGTTFRHFHPTDKTAVDLVVVSRTSDKEVVVQASAEFPSAYASSPRLYECKNTFTGLDHLDDENVSIVADGYVLASPNNDIENYETVTVSSGSCNLPNSYKGAIVHIGRPFVSDIETLDVHTVEQRPVLIESKTLNKLYVKLHESRGLYIGNEFPDDDKVNGMSALDQVDVIEDFFEIIGNRYDQPVTKRYEVTIPGDWKSQGRVCLRNVDPIHFEVLSIIPDFEDLRR